MWERRVRLMALGANTLFLIASRSGGLAFNGRRLRRNRAVLEDMLERAGWIYLRSCSEKLFGSGQYILVEDPHQVLPGRYMFEELGNGRDSYGRYGHIVLYRFRDEYPADVFLPQGLLEDYILRGTEVLKLPDGEQVDVECYEKERGGLI